MSVEQLEANSDCRQVEDISLLSHSKSVDDVYIPQVAENCKPKVGQKFESIDGAHEFYIKYAKEAGFSVRSSSTKRCKGAEEVVWKEFVCFKEGVSSIKDAGGIENIGCTKKDIYNHEAKVWNELRGQDAELLKEYFLTEQEKDPCFFFKIDVDDDGKLKRCFWADSVSRRAYGCFGDVVVFDTTYNTNQYGMIFAPLVGVNNHGQTVLFACAFLSDEKTESFVWLFELLKDSMPTNNPKMIITDQDPTMTKAIVQSLPNTFHRYCSWHILEKFSNYLNVITYRDFYKDFQQCIWESECPEKFERKWVTTIEKASLDNNDWLKSIFELCLRWVPAYVNHIFSAGMSSSQRAESSHSFFKKYISKRNLLMDFILRFNRAFAHQRHEELGADHVDINEKLVLKLPLEMEEQMAEIYTCKIFLKFQDELWNSLVIMPQFVCENTTHKMYVVKSSPKERVRRVREIAYDKELDFASCTFIDKAIIYEEASVIVNDGLQSLLGKIESIVSNTKSGGISEKGSTAHDYEALKDPSAVRAKGCGQRLKRRKEKATNAAKSSQNEESPQHASEYDSKADSLSSTGLHEKMKG
ncbi:protein FAR1-RELATED SEQUENCE 5-like [Ziziphus jujuba]|uniref:Protein FAR1-RELATED SEQUENCE 5-like n=1 Tax=Ziziphus jujuba TaxID=326968 RepID=A0ABM3ZUP5_ZIZJJ|nr:protein FAR1-RELATED SEQUENCE 5-like [Ziziphus jujuba]